MSAHDIHNYTGATLTEKSLRTAQRALRTLRADPAASSPAPVPIEARKGGKSVAFTATIDRAGCLRI